MITWVEWVISSSFLIMAIVLLRAVTRKHISAVLQYALWGVVLLRLLVPVQLFVAPVSLTAMQPLTGDRIGRTADPVSDFSEAEESALGNGVELYTAGPSQNDVQSKIQANISDNKTTPMMQSAMFNWESAVALFSWLWLAGTIIVGLVMLIFNLRFAVNLHRCRLLLKGGCYSTVPVYVADGLPSPCLFGLFRPTIYLTPEIVNDPTIFHHVLIHEETHVRHLDQVWSVLRCIALALHWWNPLVWMAVTLSRRDGEMACDEGALKSLNSEDRNSYGYTLLTLSTTQPVLSGLLNCSTTMTGSKKTLWERITRIAETPKRWLWAAALSIFIATAVTACSFTQAKELDDLSTESPSNSLSEWLKSEIQESTPPIQETDLDYSNSTDNQGDNSPVPIESEAPKPVPTANLSNIVATDDSVAMEAYKAVLCGNATFRDTGIGKDLDIAHIYDLLNFEIYWIQIYFTTIDLDGDGIREVILMLDSYARYGYEILHYQDGTVYGYYMVARGFEELKTDGTYEGSDSAFSGTVKKIESFSGNGLVEDILTQYDYHAYDYNDENEAHEYFLIHGQKVSSAQVESTLTQQRAKESAEWHELTQEHIEKIH